MWRPLLQAVVACIWCYPMWGQLDPVGNLSLTNPPPEGFHHSQLTRHRAAQSDLWTLCRELQSQKFVDLTHAFDSASPHWPGFSTMSTKTLFAHEKDGFWAEEFTHVGQYGTHVDPPAHFHKGLRTVDQIPLNEMILPLVVIDLHEKIVKDPDTVLTVDDIKAWESRNGPVPAGAFVAFRSDWSKRWPDQARMQNKDDKGVAHYPGWTLDALKLLYEQRKITASGHETLDTDPGVKTTKDIYECESYILGQNHYQIELLTNLDQVPEKGALVICTFPKPRNGSGFPARVFAIAPRSTVFVPPISTNPSP